MLRGRERRNFSSDVLWAAIVLENTGEKGRSRNNEPKRSRKVDSSTSAAASASHRKRTPGKEGDPKHIAGSRLSTEDERLVGDEARQALERVVVDLMEVLCKALQRAPLQSVHAAMHDWRSILVSTPEMDTEKDYYTTIQELGDNLQDEIDLLDDMLKHVKDQCPAGIDLAKISAASLARLANENGNAKKPKGAGGEYEKRNANSKLGGDDGDGDDDDGDDDPSVKDLAEYTQQHMEAVADFISGAVNTLRALPWDKIEGALHMDPCVMLAVKRQTAGTLRVDFVRSLLEPELYLNDGSDRDVWPDVSALHVLVNDTDRSKAVYEWFDAFQQEQSEADGSSGDGSGRPQWKKARLGDKENMRDASGAPLELKGRFAAAITTLEHHGLIKVATGGTEVRRQMFAWDSFT